MHGRSTPPPTRTSCRTRTTSCRPSSRRIAAGCISRPGTTTRASGRARSGSGTTSAPARSSSSTSRRWWEPSWATPPGVAPGYRFSLGYGKLELSSEGEYVFDSRDSADSFFYNWSELSFSPAEWIRAGVVVQRTRLYGEDRDVQRGFLVGFSWKKAYATAYLFNPDLSKPTFVLRARPGLLTTVPMSPLMKAFLRRHPVATPVTVAILLAIAGVALAPWWIDLRPVRARIESAASSALGGTLTFERIDLSWFPRTEVVVRSVKVSIPGKARGTVRAVRVSPALLPLLRGRVSLSKIGVDGLDLAVDLPAPAKNGATRVRPRSPIRCRASALAGVSSAGRRREREPDRAVAAGPRKPHDRRAARRGRAPLGGGKGRAHALAPLRWNPPRLLVEGSLRADATVPERRGWPRSGSDLDVTDVREKLLSFAGDDPVIAAIFAIVRGGTLTSFSFASSGKAPGDLGALERMSIHAAVRGREGPHRRSGPRTRRRQRGRRARRRSPLRGARRGASREVAGVGRAAS